jgi:hypothetical protein
MTSQNAFSDRLSPLGFNFFLMFIVDLMHDFELGTWRAIFVHFLRILDSVDANLLIELDRRWEVIFVGCSSLKYLEISSFRELPNFGDSIRKFTSNASEMKKLAARDLENLLQVCLKHFCLFIDTFIMIFSALYPCLKVFYLNPTTAESSNYFFYWHTGTH